MSTKISQLTSATDITASDLMQIVDVEDGVMAPSGTNKKATAQLVANNLAKIVNDGAVITANTSTDAVRITQTGSGNALVVEDGESPDNTPVVITNNGKLIIGADSPTYEGLFEVNGTQAKAYGSISCYGNTSGGGELALIKTRGDSHDSKTIVNANDYLGSIYYQGTDGEKNCVAAQISSTVDGTPAEDSMPGRILFSTTPSGSVTPFERMRITSAGNVGIGTTNPTAKLNVVDSGSQDALRITQTGSGNALVVEDSTNPDATPVVIDANGRFVSGTTSVQTFGYGTQTPHVQVHTTLGSQIGIMRWNNDENPSILQLAKSRGESIGTRSAVQSGDAIGVITFDADNGTNSNTAAQITAIVDGTPGVDDMPGALAFQTSPGGSGSAFQRMRITSTGNVGIGTTIPSSKLHVAGDLTVSSATTSTSATAGTNGDVPAQVAGYLVVNINGTARKIPYYA